MQVKSRFVAICDWHGSANHGHDDYAATTFTVRSIPLSVETWLQSHVTFLFAFSAAVCTIVLGYMAVLHRREDTTVLACAVTSASKIRGKADSLS